MTKLYYDLPNVSVNFVDQNKVPNTYSLRAIRAFLYHIIEDQKLTIAEYLANMGNDPFFLVAATGLGKTVAVPVHVYLKNCERVLSGTKVNKGILLERSNVPKVWVVEPKISIAEDQERFMNSLFAEFVKFRKNDKDPVNPVFFGCKTSNRDSNNFAPIKFVTTGIFAIAARLNWINPELDTVIIDEAHVTIASDEGVELGIAICRQKGIPVHYMSATVDIDNLEQTLEVSNVIRADNQRFPIWMHNTKLPLDNCIVDLVEQVLVKPNLHSEYFPKGDNPTSQAIRSAVLEEGRAKGLLVVVNSFAGENSDARKIANLLRRSWYGDQIEVLLLASAVIRSYAEKRDFDQLMMRIEQEGLKYIIVATSVVEMGVTFPTLDFVVTMDSGYEDITIDDFILSELAPLGVNSLKQRIGRVGRKRPGIGYITCEADAYYSSLDDEQLNEGGLVYEPIKLPMTKGTLSTLAFYSFANEWVDLRLELTKLNLPSAIQLSEERMMRLQYERSRLIAAGVAVGNKLTTEGEYCERWLGLVDIEYAIKVQEALASGNKTDVIFYLVAAALSNVSIRNLYDRREEPIFTKLKEPKATDGENHQWQLVHNSSTGGFDMVILNPETMKPYDIKHGLQSGDDSIEYSPIIELITLYNIVSYFSLRYGLPLFGIEKNVGVVRKHSRRALFDECSKFGFRGESVLNLLKSVKDTFTLFADNNRKREDFKALFGEVSQLGFEELMPHKLEYRTTLSYRDTLKTLSGRSTIVITAVGNGEFSWKEVEGVRAGLVKQGQLGLYILDGLTMVAKVVPEASGTTRVTGESWKIVHPQIVGVKDNGHLSMSK